MCGRYQLTATPESIAEHFELPRLTEALSVDKANKTRLFIS